MRFLYPEYLKLLFVLLGLLPFWLFYQHTKRKTRLSLGDSRPLRRLSRLSSRARDWTRFIGLNVVLAAMILALARPQWIHGKMVPQPAKMDIVFLLDISPSMYASDIQPTRLDRALEVIRAFAHNKPPQDRIGLVSFSSGSLVLSYLTEDPENISFYLDYLKQNPVLSPGTNIGRALLSGLTILAKDREANPAAARNKRVFVLLSDGEDHGAELESAVAAVKKTGVKVHTIGIGSKEGGPFPIAWDDGRPVYQLDSKGNQVITRLDERTLRWVAEQTEGQFYRSFTGQELQKIFAQIAMKEREIQGFKKAVEYQDVYHEFLLAALGAFLATMLL
ncbi:MAG TPA: VWA domain-containing protein [Candidatus Acidoferrales bacterium]|nr:VWA domain-containing protein [Candidatus Acidoferrales bacterium]